MMKSKKNKQTSSSALETIKRFDRLEELARKNGRYVATKNGSIVTADFVDGCDAQYFDNVADAITWEEGYR